MNGEQRFGGGRPKETPRQGPMGRQSGPREFRGPDQQWAEELGEKVKDLGMTSITTIVEVAENAGKNLNSVGLKMNQIRRFLTEVRKIESEFKRNKDVEELRNGVVLLRPKLAYAAGRQREEVGPLLRILDPAIKSVGADENRFRKLLRLIESIVAYHRAEGGKN